MPEQQKPDIRSTPTTRIAVRRQQDFEALFGGGIRAGRQSHVTLATHLAPGVRPAGLIRDVSRCSKYPGSGEISAAEGNYGLKNQVCSRFRSAALDDQSVTADCDRLQLPPGAN